MIKIIVLCSIYGLSLGNRLLLQHLVLPPPGHSFGAFGQFCPHAEPGARCGSTADVANDLTDPGFLNCERPNGCCLCSSISCGSDTNPCQRFIAGSNSVQGVKAINIISDAQTHSVIECMGDNSCEFAAITAKAITQVSCGGRYACKNAVIVIDEPNNGFELNCAVTGSCDGLQISLNIPGPPAGFACDPTKTYQELMFGAIECVGVGACDNLIFLLNNQGCGNIIFESIECRDSSCQGAHFGFIGHVEFETCMLSASGLQPLGLDRCYQNLFSLSCPEYASCQNEMRRIVDPSDGFELFCDGELSCAGATFDIEISNNTRVEPTIGVHMYCTKVNSCQDANVIVNNANTKEVRVNLHCMHNNACQNAVFTSNVGVVFESVMCEDPVFCPNCRVNGVACDRHVPAVIV